MAVGKNFEAEKTTNHVSAASGMSSVCYLFSAYLFSVIEMAQMLS